MCGEAKPRRLVVADKIRGAWSPPRRWPVYALALVAGCATVPEEQYSPFFVPEEQFRAAVETIVVTPVVAPAHLHTPPEVAARVDSIIEAELRGAGLTVVPAAAYQAIWDRILRQLGGFFDPITGKRDDRKFAVARAELLDELAGRYATKVLLFSELQIVDAEVDDGLARWDGTSQVILDRSSDVLARFRDTFEPDEFGGGDDGIVGAVTLMVAVDGSDGGELYRNFGGVEVLGAAQRPASGYDFELVGDADRLAWAVGVALGPLVTREDASARARPRRDEVP